MKGLVIADRSYGNRYLILTVSVFIVGLLIFVLLDRLEREMARAEYAKFELRLTEMRSALLLQQLKRHTQQASVNRDAMTLHTGVNPMVWLASAEGSMPLDYYGSASLNELPVDIAEGHWVYDVEQQVIAYLPKSSRWKNRLDGRDSWLKFQVQALSEAQEGSSFRLQALQTNNW